MFRRILSKTLHPPPVRSFRPFTSCSALCGFHDHDHHHDHHGESGHDWKGGPREKRLWTLPVFMLGWMPIVCFGLGTWQVQRLQWKLNLIDDLHDKLQRDPMTLPRNINLAEIPNFEYRKVRIQGVWDHEHSILLGPRTRENVLGYHVITPLIRGDRASTILVDRGFVSRDVAKRNSSILRGSGSREVVEVLGLLRQSQATNRFTPENNAEKGEWYWADVDALALHAGGPQAGVQPVYVEAIYDGNTGAASERLAAGIPIGRSSNIELRNMHTTYAITWYTLSLATGVMFFNLVRSARQKRLAALQARGILPMQ